MILQIRNITGDSVSTVVLFCSFKIKKILLVCNHAIFATLSLIDSQSNPTNKWSLLPLHGTP